MFYPYRADNPNHRRAKLVALTAGDKKNRSGTLSYVLARGIGDTSIVRDVTEAELLAAAEAMLAQMQNKPRNQPRRS